MKEYTILACISVIAVFILDNACRTNILKKPIFYFFILIIFGFKLLVNGYLTGTQIVQYNPRFFLGLRITSIPVEDFLFGFSMVAMSIVFWEYFKRRGA